MELGLVLDLLAHLAERAQGGGDVVLPCQLRFTLEHAALQPLQRRGEPGKLADAEPARGRGKGTVAERRDGQLGKRPERLGGDETDEERRSQQGAEEDDESDFAPDVESAIV